MLSHFEKFEEKDIVKNQDDIGSRTTQFLTSYPLCHCKEYL